MSERISDDELRQALEAATPGPWSWEVNKRHKKVELSGGKQTKAGGDLTVLSFARWGLQGAAPVFWTWHGNVAEEPQRADQIAVAAPGRNHHADWFARIDHPDARLIALAPALAAEVLQLREALKPFAAVAEHDIGDDETDGEAFRPMQFLNRAPRLKVGDLRRARAALTGGHSNG